MLSNNELSVLQDNQAYALIQNSRLSITCFKKIFSKCSNKRLECWMWSCTNVVLKKCSKYQTPNNNFYPLWGLTTAIETTTATIL